jgi:hypothetical protein
MKDAEAISIDVVRSQLLESWANVLGLAPESIRPEDHFVRLGGTSLLALQCATHAATALHRTFDPMLLLQKPVFREQVELVHSALQADDEGDLDSDSILWTELAI